MPKNIVAVEVHVKIVFDDTSEDRMYDNLQINREKLTVENLGTIRGRFNAMLRAYAKENSPNTRFTET